MARRVRIVTVAHNDAWCLPGHLSSVTAQRAAGDVELDYHYIHYGCTDPTPILLQRFAEHTGARITDAGPAPREAAAEMGLRCRMLGEAADAAVGDGCDAVLFIHPRIRIPERGVQLLIDAGRPVIGGVATTDRCYDLPLASRTQNVWLAGPDGRAQPTVGGIAGIQRCAAITHVYLVTRSALQSGVAPVPDPLGEDVGFARTALVRNVPLAAHGGVRCVFTPGPEDIYLESASLAKIFCQSGTVRIQAIGDRQVVTFGAMAVAKALQSALAASIADRSPSLSGWSPATFTLKWNEQFAQIEFRRQPTPTAQEPPPPAAALRPPARHP